MSLTDRCLGSGIGGAALWERHFFRAWQEKAEAEHERWNGQYADEQSQGQNGVREPLPDHYATLCIARGALTEDTAKAAKHGNAPG